MQGDAVDRARAILRAERRRFDRMMERIKRDQRFRVAMEATHAQEEIHHGQAKT